MRIAGFPTASTLLPIAPRYPFQGPVLNPIRFPLTLNLPLPFCDDDPARATLVLLQRTDSAPPPAPRATGSYQRSSEQATGKRSKLRMPAARQRYVDGAQAGVEREELRLGPP